MADESSRAGTRYATPELLAYVDRLHAPHDEGLLAAFEAPRHEGMPSIQVGQSEGKLLTLLLRLSGAQKVVEVGTLAGYSAMRIARALGPSGRVYTIENSPKHHQVAQANVARAGLAGQVECLLGDGLSKLAELEAKGPFDAVFIDADKGNYDRYGRWAAQNIRKGGLLLGDNAYLFGHLLDDSDDAKAMRRFHEESREAFDTVCIPTPDGLVLGIRK
jgi:predicted O-methyltransferase YrrM